MPDPRTPRTTLRVAVIGGGISGLAAALRLKELHAAAEVTVLEAGERLGGALLTEETDGFLVEHGADNFITNVPWGVDLCRRLGIEGDLQPTNSRHRQAFVVRRGKLHAVPAGFMLMSPQRLRPILTTRLLGPLGKLRLLCERFVRRRSDGADESLADFARRRLGRQAYERLVQPLVGGIYTADAEQLSIRAALPRFVELEKKYGSLIRAARAERKSTAPRASSSEPVASAPGSSLLGELAASATGSSSDSAARYSMFVAPRQGMSQIVDAIVRKTRSHSVPVEFRTRCTVESVTRDEGGWRIDTKSELRPSLTQGVAQGESFRYSHVILAVPAYVAAKLLARAAAELADELAKIPYAGSVVACLGYARQQIAHALDGFGFVVPAIENRRILAGSFSSVKFPGRAPQRHELLRVFLGGALQPELVQAGDDELLAIVQQELAELLGIRGEPALRRILRWPRAMPQYTLGHLERVARIERLASQLAGLHLAGSAYHGVGVPNCIHSGEQAAEACA